MMEPRTLGYVEESCNGQLVAGQRSARVSRVCTDSRLARPGDLFIAIRGDRFDGHAYLTDALGQGAEAGVVSRSRPGARPLLMTLRFAGGVTSSFRERRTGLAWATADQLELCSASSERATAETWISSVPA